MNTTGPDGADITVWAVAAAAGDQAAAAAFIRHTQSYVHQFLAHLIDRREADDLTQETYLRAMRALPQFAGRASAKTWLLAIARRVAADHIRSITARPRTAALDDWESVAETAYGRQHDGSFEDHVLLRELLVGLAPERREAFVATQVLGLSYAEAAEVCACPVGTIRSRVARAREDLAAALGGQTRPGPQLRAVS